MERRQDFTIRLNVYDKEDMSDYLQEKLVNSLVVLLEIFALSTKALKEKRFIRYFKNALVGNDEKVKDAVAKLAKLTESEDRLVNAETLVQAKKSGRAIDGVADTVGETQKMVADTGIKLSQVTVEVSDFRQEMRKEFANVAMAIQDSHKDTTANIDTEASLQAFKSLLRPSVYPQGMEGRHIL